MLDPHNLWVYNSTSPATSELPEAIRSSSTPYKPEANVSTTNPLKIAANTTAVDSYVSDSFVNEKLKSIEVQLTADGNITVTSKVNINSSSTYKLYFQTSKGGQEYSGNIKINNATIDVSAGVQVGAQGNITIANSDLTSKGALTVASGNKKSITINNSNLSGDKTTILSMSGKTNVTGSRLNGTTSVSVGDYAGGESSISDVTVNTKKVIIGGGNIAVDNATLNVTPQSADQGIFIGTNQKAEIELNGMSTQLPVQPAKNVVIKNSTLNTTGSTEGIINIQGSTANGLEPNFCSSFHSQ